MNAAELLHHCDNDLTSCYVTLDAHDPISKRLNLLLIGPQRRSSRAQIHSTYIGSILASVNPYKIIPGLYDCLTVESYSKHRLGEISPHIFALANECYRCLWKRLENQCVLISGESGAGKTESTKLILRFLSAMSQRSLEVTSKEKTSHVEQALLESSPIMEAFGNAKTVYNNNSSRFGKFVQLNFSENYYYLKQSGCTADKTINDVETFQDVMTAMKVMQFSNEDIHEILRLLAGVLHLGNIEFMTAGGAQVSSKSALGRASELLGLDSMQLAEVLTHKSMLLRGEEISTPLTVEQAVDSRDSMAMALYSQCFSWIIKKLNSRIKGKEDFKSIGILDIFGFENFEVNRFEQFSINYANEKLQEYFNKHIFSLEQLEYNKEGLVWEDINWMDNGECLDLIEKMPDQFDQSVVLNQLRYSGMLETVRIRRAGFPVRRNFLDFYTRYKVLMKNMTVPEDVKEKCRSLLHTYDSTSAEWQLGKTKVFLRESLEHKLEKQREVEVYKAAMIIQARIMGYMARKQYRKVLQCIVVIQKNYRTFFWRRRFLHLRKAAVTLQKQVRGKLARKIYSQLLEERQRKEEEEEKQRLEVERLAQQAEEARKQQELAALLKAQEEEMEHSQAGEKPQDTTQVEEILRLEREIQDLQRKKEQQELSLTEASLQRLQLLRDDELRRLEEEACRAAQEFLESLNFDEIDECVRNIESCLSVGSGEAVSMDKPNFNFSQPNPEEEVDEGFEADDDAFKDSPSSSEHGHSDQRTSGIRTSDDSSEEDPYINDTVITTLPNPAITALLLPIQDSLNMNMSASKDLAYCIGDSMSGSPQDSVELIPPNEDSDYDQDDYDDGAIASGSSMTFSNPRSGQWSSDYRFSVGTYNSSGAYHFSSEGAQSSFEDSEDDFDSRFDTDDELSYRRDSVYSCVSLPYFHSFLFIKGGLMNIWKRRWCVLKDETFLWFRSKQEALKQGWLHKKGGGSSTLSRRNWKRRWFVLRQTKLMYFENDGEEKLKGTLDMRAAKEIIDNTGKENGIDVVMPERTYHLIAETAEDARQNCSLFDSESLVSSQWFSVLSQVHGSTEQEIREMHDEQANPQNAVGTIDVGLIDSVCAFDNPERPNSFVIITTNRVLHCNADTPEEMHHWITLLQRSKGDTRVEGQEFLVRGWLHKEMKNSTKTSMKLKKRWFVLTHNSLDYYKSSERNALKLGTLVLNSLCSAVPPDEKTFKETGKTINYILNSYWNVTVYGRKHCYRLYTKLLNEATRWSSAIQNVIDTKVPIDTPTQQLIQDIKIVEKLMRGLAMEDSRNMFALFEHNGTTDKAIESRTIVADILAKFEKLAASTEEGSNQWKFYFKLYCFLDTDNVPKDSVEFAFMFEQAHEAVIRGHYPAPEETLQFLAALRLQYVQGDFTTHTTMPEMEEVYPMERLKARITQSTKTFTPTQDRCERKRSSFLEGTLRRSFRGGSITKQKLVEEQMLDVWVKEEITAAKTNIIDKWKKLQSMTQAQAMVKYMALVKEWPGYGSTLFNVECKEGGFPKDLWLGVSGAAISIYKRGEPRPLEIFQYEHILSFGTPLSNTYKIVVDDRELLFETIQVVDIAKLMKAYISMIVKKRYSTPRSFGSQGSQCSSSR
ncbi:Unconventional myosin-X [Acipenser ruthenus]|uniref:Unconventional myosin-X n=1 Tax=Acipenser ruthenus TaxID=7906 RepID=A0A444TYD2_ACIRT|nr:Unconventional myosin-X [Acipenser ruthenus]